MNVFKTEKKTYNVVHPLVRDILSNVYGEITPGWWADTVATLEPACKVRGCKVFSDIRSIF